MADNIDNLGKKGRGFAWALVYFIMFVLLLIYLYQRNGDALPQ